MQKLKLLTFLLRYSAAVQALLGKVVVAEAGYSTVAAKQGSKVRMLAVASKKDYSFS